MTEPIILGASAIWLVGVVAFFVYFRRLALDEWHEVLVAALVWPLIVGMMFWSRR